jgi:hypothetical protein
LFLPLWKKKSIEELRLYLSLIGNKRLDDYLCHSSELQVTECEKKPRKREGLNVASSYSFS